MPSTPTKRINFPVWVPEDARAALSTFYNITFSELDGRYMLQRLATRPSMQEAWTQLNMLRENYARRSCNIDFYDMAVSQTNGPFWV